MASSLRWQEGRQAPRGEIRPGPRHGLRFDPLRCRGNMAAGASRSSRHCPPRSSPVRRHEIWQRPVRPRQHLPLGRSGSGHRATESATTGWRVQSSDAAITLCASGRRYPRLARRSGSCRSVLTGIPVTRVTLSDTPIGGGFHRPPIHTRGRSTRPSTPDHHLRRRCAVRRSARRRAPAGPGSGCGQTASRW